MDKKSKAIIIFLITLSIFTNTMYLQNKSVNANIETNSQSENQANKEIGIEMTYKEKLIRFHVLANSDSPEDQELKLKVRDSVIESMNEKLSKSKSIDQTREIINENMEAMTDLAKEVISKNGYNYEVLIKLEPYNFPTKSYGKFTLPAGEYEAVRILIGEAKGANWWCVMFPPLCFIDSGSATVDEETDRDMKKHLTQAEYNEISMDKDENEGLVLKSKILESIKNWM